MTTIDTTYLAVLLGTSTDPSNANEVERAIAIEVARGRGVHLTIPVAVPTWDAIDEAVEDGREHPVLNAIHLALHTDAVTVAVVAHDEAVMEGLEGIVCSQDGMLIPEHAGYRTFRRVKRMSAAQNALTLTREEDGSALALTARMIALAQRFGVPVYEPLSEVLVDSDLADEIARAVLHAISPRLEAVEDELREMQRRVSISRGLTVVAPTGHREAPRFDAPARLRG